MVEAAEPGATIATETASPSDAVPRVRVEACHRVLANCREDGSLPTDCEIAARFGHKDRWGRPIKQWGQQGRVDKAVVCVPKPGSRFH
ncbi:hypothetical protein [Streptomonospora alba]|uniref:hypothetical protein n=1 Tax=Streptomonospora alba TaxID=183763 RepID=UPI00069ADA81|nr:hypothetical protein [Streptomonospora alba]